MSLLNKEEEIFRLAAVLYKDGNYEVSKENTLKKIVKAIFLENDNIPKTISEIISAIFENYNLNFSENEIEVVIEKGSKIFQITKPQPVKYNLTEKNYIKLKNKIENMEQDEKMEVTENINIKELPEEQTLNFKDKNIKVVGGKWSLQSMEKAQKYAEETEFDIEFINATEVFRNSDKLKNSDIIIFDTSYNSHSAYYKLKSYGLKIYRISTSNLEKIKKLNYT